MLNNRFIPIFLCVLLSLTCFQACQSPKTQKANHVCFNAHCLEVEVVHKQEDLNRGLQFRPFLNEESGMLFVFSNRKTHSFWMKDTLIPLDIIWMDHAQRIIHIKDNVPPCEIDPCQTYKSNQPALYVLEVNAGKAEDWDLRLGDRAKFQLKQNW